MAKLIIELNDGESGNTTGIQVEMKLEVSKKGQRTLSDAVLRALPRAWSTSCLK